MTLFDLPPPPSGDMSSDLQTAEGLLQLLALPGIGPAKAIKLAAQHGGWETVDSASAEEQLIGKAAESLVQPAPRAPELPTGTRLVGYFDQDFPRRCVRSRVRLLCCGSDQTGGRTAGLRSMRCSGGRLGYRVPGTATSTQTRRWSELGKPLVYCRSNSPVSRDSGSLESGQNTPASSTRSGRDGST